MSRRRVTLKDHFSETRLFLHRTIWMLVFIGVLITLSITRLIYLQVINHKHYTTLSNDNRVKLVAIPPTRGLIYDRNGVLLADNLPAYRLEITPEQVKNMDQLLAKLQETIEISDDDIDSFRRHIKRKRPFESIPLRFRLTDEEVARLAVIRHRLPGVNIVASLNRHYPLGESMAHVVGYVGRIDEKDLQELDPTNYRGTTHTGKIGVEKYYEDLLHGQVGYQQVETNAQGRTVRVLEDNAPVPGRNLYLTLDARLQEAAEKALGEFSGAVVAMDPRTGEVLAMVSKPGYDPNSFVNGISTAEYNALSTDSAQPLFNRVLRGRYPPGSTIKPFVGLAGLQYGVTDEAREEFCPGYYTLPGEERKFRDWKRWGHGRVNLDQAITQSCDVYFYDLARNLGIDRIHEFLAQFGFGLKTGVDLPSEKAGLLPSRAWKRAHRRQPWFPGETLNTGIGQGFTLATPLQLAEATAALAMRGRRAKPRLLHAIQDPGTKASQLVPPELLQPVNGVKPEYWDYIIHAMVHVVHGPHGTAHKIKDAPFRIAGKTGTAQVFGIKQEEVYNAEDIALKLRDHALFIAFAPADDPAIAVSVVVENGGSGGSVAAPIARKVLDEYLLRDTQS
jgi:penicillin-binding protein 2